MIVGEAEVQGQVKRAYELALVEGVTGPDVQPALPRRARRRQARAHRDRVGALARVGVVGGRGARRRLAGRPRRPARAGDRRRRERRAHRHAPCASAACETVFVANRRYDRAIGLAQRFGGAARSLRRRCPRELERADIVVSSHRRAAPDRRPRGARVRGRAAEGRPLVLIDIAVPRDIDPSVRDCPGITLYDMDDLQRAVARNLERARGRGRARRACSCARRSRASSAGSPASTWCPRSRRCGGAATRSWSRCCARTSRAGSRCRRPTASASRRMARAVVSRLLHEPTLRLKGAAGEGASYRYVQALRELFGLEARAGAARGRARRGHPARRPPPAPRPVIRLGTRGSALALAQAQLGRGAPAGRGRAGADHDLRGRADSGSDPRPRRGRRQVALRQGDRGGAARRARSTWPCTRPRTCPAELPDGLAIVGVPERADPRDALCGAASLDDARRGRGRRHGEPAPPRRSCSRCGPTSTCASCAATSTRACASSPRATSTRSCWRRPGSTGSAAATRARRSTRPRACPRPGQGCLALEARAGRRARVRGRRGRCTDRDALACLTAERAVVRRARRDLPHAGRRARASSSGDGSAADRLRRAAGRLALDPRRARRPTADDPRRSGATVAERMLRRRARRAARRGRARCVEPAAR